MYGKLNRRRFKPLKVLFFVGMAIAFVAVLGGIIMLLWNAILPNLLGLRAITLWEAIGLLILCRLLFGGIRYGFFGKRRAAHFAKRREWRNKWMDMSDDERRQFKEQWKQRCKQKGK